MERKRLYLLAISLIALLSQTSCGDIIGGDSDKAIGTNSIVETGEIAAVNSKAFTLARYGRYFYEMKVIGILEHGAILNEGDSIIQLDPTEVKKFIVDRETNLEGQVASLEVLKVNQENSKNEQESKMKNEIATFNLKKIELEASRFEPERIKKIKQLEFRQAEIRLEKEKKKLELNKIISANEFRIQEIRVNQTKSDIKNAYDILPALTIRTPIPGVFQIAQNRRTGNLLKVGDQLYPGANMASVPELRWMKVDTHINETDFLKIRLGQKVSVRLDAMPNAVFDGEVQYIGRLCYLKDNKSKQKVFDVEVRMLKIDERLKPGMTVSCEYLDK